MSKYSVIVFDLGNVLISFDYKPMIRKFNEIKSGLGDKFATQYKDNYHVHRDFEKGMLNTKQFLSIMLDWLEQKVNEQEFMNIFSDIFTLNHNVIDLLPKLKEKYNLVLLSNTNAIHQKYGWSHYDFLHHFNKLILSHEVGAVKPEEKIYRAVEEFTQKPSSEHFFIDDVKEYVDGAEKCGWEGIQFINYSLLHAELKGRHIL